MRLIEKEITGYATSYKEAYQYSSSYPWSDVDKAFDWSPSVSPTDLSANSWRSTYASAKIYWSTSSSYKWYLDGIGTFKSCLNDNFEDAYDGTGKEYTNFSCIPEGSEIKKINFLVRSSIPTYRNEQVTYYKNDTNVTYDSSGANTNIMYKSTKKTECAVTEGRMISGTSYDMIGQIWEKLSDGKFYSVSYSTGVASTSEATIGEWSLSDFKNGLFLPRVQVTSNSTSANTAYWYPRGFAVKLTCMIPLYTISGTPQGGGSVSGGKESFGGKTVVLKATPDRYYEFSHWIVDGVIDKTSGSTLSISVSKDINAVAVFEKSRGCITYDTIFSFKKWKEEGITSGSCTVSDITDTGFTLKSNASNNDGYTDVSPRFRVSPNTQYYIDIDCVGSGWQVFIFYYPDDTSAYTSHRSGSTKSTLFTTPSDCNYIAIRIDANALNNTITVSNFRVYPAIYKYMSSTVSAEQRSHLDEWAFPNPVMNAGYLFDGWNTDPDGLGTPYTKDSDYPKEDIVLYSQWLYPIFVKGKPLKYICKGGKIARDTYGYPKKPIYFNANFYNWDGSYLKSYRTLYNHTPINIEIPTRSPDNDKVYTFSHWDKEFIPLKKDDNYTAVYTSSTRYYTIRFGYYDINNNFILLKEQSLEYGDPPTAPTNTDRDREFKDGMFYYYEYKGWDTSVSPVTRDYTYVAQYNVTQSNLCSVTWVIGDRVETTQCAYGSTPVPPYSVDDTIHMNGQSTKLIGWRPEISVVKGDTSYSAIAQLTTTITSTNCLHTSTSGNLSNDSSKWANVFDKDPETYGYYAGGSSIFYSAGTFFFSGLTKDSQVKDIKVQFVCEEYGNSYTDYVKFNLCHSITTSGQYTDCGDGEKGVSYLGSDYDGVKRTISYTSSDLPETRSWLNSNLDKVIEGQFGVYLKAYRMRLYEFEVTLTYTT